MDTILLIISLVMGLLGIIVIFFGYLKDKTSSPYASKILGKRIFTLALVIAILNSIVPLINHCKPKPPPPATKQDVEQLFADYMGKKPNNPPTEEVKSEIEKELKAAFERKKKRALQLYQKGNTAYENNQYKEAISYIKSALEIVKIPSFYFSFGNSYLVTSDFRSALKYYKTALSLYRDNNNRHGEGNVLVNLGSAYYYLGQYDKAIEHYNQALAVAREIGDRNGEGSRLGGLGIVYYSLGQYDKAIGYYNQALAIAREIGDRNGEGNVLVNLGSVYYSLGQYDKAKQHLEQAFLILKEIKSPYAEIVRRKLAELEAR